MHFWIDKRSALWGRRGCGKTMVTPVHRFQAVEAVMGRSHHSHHRYHPRHSSAGSMPVAPRVAPPPDLDAAVFLEHPLPAGPSLAATGRLKCGMWASFALVTVFMAGAKFYFNTQSTGLEVLVFCALLVVVLFAGCAVSLCEAVTAPVQPQLGVTTAPAVVNAVPAAPVVATEPLSEPPPPPYHIAVLLPPPRAPPAPPSPPPAYDKAVTVS